jgi:GntR family histidine utilization transcriptional repressor
MSQATLPKPLYQTIKNYVVEHIDSGQWRPGTRIPSESEIVKILGASRMTVNRAIRELYAEGRVTRLQGVGTFVAKPRPPATILEIRGIRDEITGRGGIHTCQVILAHSLAATDHVASLLEVPPGSSVFHLLLVHLENDRPVQIEDRYVNPATAPDFLDQDFTRNTPSDTLLEFLPVTEIEHRIESKLPDSRECELLRIPPTEPCLKIYRRSWSGRHVVTRVLLVNPGSTYSVGGRFRLGGITQG